VVICSHYSDAEQPPYPAVVQGSAAYLALPTRKHAGESNGKTS